MPVCRCGSVLGPWTRSCNSYSNMQLTPRTTPCLSGRTHARQSTCAVQRLYKPTASQHSMRHLLMRCQPPEQDPSVLADNAGISGSVPANFGNFTYDSSIGGRPPGTSSMDDGNAVEPQPQPKPASMPYVPSGAPETAVGASASAWVLKVYSSGLHTV